MRLGALEIGLILVIVLIVFGAGKLPQVGSAFGKAIREFKKEKDGVAENPQVTASTTSTPKVIESKVDTEKKS
jgi:sec-independent protein translocase protein TatA